MVRALSTILSLNRVGFGLAYVLAPDRAGGGWIGRAARDSATQVFIRGHGARDLALGGGALFALAGGRHDAARGWLAAAAITDAADFASTLAAGRRLPQSGRRFALVMAGASAAVAFAGAAAQDPSS
jgi:uncharacterized caspase-like protein